MERENKKFHHETQVRDRQALFILHGKFIIVLCENNGFGKETVLPEYSESFLEVPSVRQILQSDFHGRLIKQTA